MIGQLRVMTGNGIREGERLAGLNRTLAAAARTKVIFPTQFALWSLSQHRLFYFDNWPDALCCSTVWLPVWLDLLCPWLYLHCSSPVKSGSKKKPKFKGGSKTIGGSRTAYCCLLYWTCCSLLQLPLSVATSWHASRLTRVWQSLLYRIQLSGYLYDFKPLRCDPAHFANLFGCLI